MPTEKKSPAAKTKNQCAPGKTVSKFMERIQKGEFVFLGEIVPGRTVNLTTVLQEATEMKPHVVAFNVAENPRSRVMMNGLAVATYIQTKLEIETILDVTCRDMNRLGLASLLLGVAGVGIRNILTLSGDHPMLGDLPHTKPVFDLDSTQLLQLAREIVDNRTVFGKKIEETDQSPPQFHIGIGANPNTDTPEAELLKIARKIELGAEFIQTQPIFDLKKTDPFLKELKKFGIPVIVGLFPMQDYDTALSFDNFIPSVRVPTDLLSNFKKNAESTTPVKQKLAEYDQINLNFFLPSIKELKTKGYAAGAHIMAVHYTRILEKLIQ